jgi:hypothetical protein
MPKAKTAQPDETLGDLTDDQKLAQFISTFYDDPLGYVHAAFTWGEGELTGLDGPDAWQKDFLIDLGKEVKKRKFNGTKAVAPIRVAASSGHGVGKSTLTGWLVSWIMDTRPNSQGSVSANTGLQLSTKTWASIKTWKQRAITSHWYEIGAEKIKHLEHRDSWFCSALTSNEDRSEAFAGQHAASSTSYYIFDEASAIPDKIFEVAEGGLTDGEPMIFLMGNPTKNSGKFYRACFGDEKNRWKVYCIDSRLGKFTNKETIQEWADQWGEDSDFFRVRVLGLPPRASDTQFIPQDLVAAAMKREAQPLSDEPLVVGVDISRGGMDNTVIRFRRGPDAASIPPVRISGEDSRDSMRTVSILSEIMNREYTMTDGKKIKPSALFVDETGVGGPIGDRLRQSGVRNVIGVQFGQKSPVTHCLNMRAFIWFQMRDWLKIGSIGKDQTLEMELTGPGYSHNAQSAIQLESKESMRKRGVGSPDDADALAVTFAQVIAASRPMGFNGMRDAIVRHMHENCENSWMA